jgi:hypothetical protein
MQKRHCNDCSSLFIPARAGRKICPDCMRAFNRKLARNPEDMFKQFLNSIDWRLAELRACPSGDEMEPSLGYRNTATELSILEALSRKTLIEYTFALFHPKLHPHERITESLRVNRSKPLVNPTREAHQGSTQKAST